MKRLIMNQDNIFIKFNKSFKNFYTKADSIKVFHWLFQRWHLIALFFYGLTPLLWFKDEYIYRSEETGYLNYSYLWENFLYAWSSHFNNGTPATALDHIVLYPVGVFYKIAAILGMPNYLTQRIFFVLVFYLIIFCVYKLIFYFIQNRSVCFLSVMFYTSSLYIISTSFYTAKMFQLFLMPAFFYLFIKYLETKKSIYLALNFIVVIVFQGISTNLPTTIPTFLIYLVAFIYYYLIKVNFSKIKDGIKYIFYFFLTVVPTMMYTYILYFFSVIYSTQYKSIFSPALPRAESKLSNLMQLFKGAWWEPHAIYNIWHWFYDNPIIVTIAYILLVFVLIGIFKLKLVNQSMRKTYVFWLSFFLIAMFLAHGIAKPFPWVYAWMYQNVPLFSLFREPWAKFTPLLIFSSTILFAHTLKLFENRKRIIYPIIFLLIIIHSSLLFTNKVFNHNNPGLGDTDILVPKFWSDAQTWSMEHKNDNVLLVPIYSGYPYYYEWYKGKTGNFNGFLPYLFLYSNSTTNTVTNLISGTQLDKVQLLTDFNPKILPLWNVEYVLDQKDISAPKEITRTVTAEILQKDGVINTKPDKSFGPLDLYHINDKYFLPRIYASILPTYADGDYRMLPSLGEAGYLNNNPAIFFTEDNPDINFDNLGFVNRLKLVNNKWQTSLPESNFKQVEFESPKPKLNFREINPTRYVVTADEVSDSFWLIFSQNYHPYWRAYLRPKRQSPDSKFSKIIEKSAWLSVFSDLGRRVEIKDHYLANGYANGWYVDSTTIKDFEIVLEYWPQRLFETMWLIFGIALSTGFGYLGFYLIKIKKIKNS